MYLLKKNIPASKRCVRIGVLLLTFIVQFSTQPGFSQSHAGLTKKAQSAYERGDYEEAVEYLFAAVRKKTDYDKAHQLLVVVFPIALDTKENRVKNLQASLGTFQGDHTVKLKREVVQAYQGLIEMNTTAKNLPPMVGEKSKETVKLETRDYSREIGLAQLELQEAKLQVAEMHYKKGIELMTSDDIDQNKAAALEFKAAIEFGGAYKDASTRYAEAQKKGTTRIAIIPLENNSNMYQYGDVGGIITDDLTSQLMRDRGAMEFTEIIDRSQLDLILKEQNFSSSNRADPASAAEMGKLLGVHKLLIGNITQISSITNPVSTQSYSEQKEVVVGSESYTKSNGKTGTRSIYGTVYANITKYTKTAKATIRGAYKIIDVKTARVLTSGTIQESIEYSNSWAEGRGDDKAISSDTRLLLSRKDEPTPSDVELVNEAIKKVVASLTAEVASFMK